MLRCCGAAGAAGAEDAANAAAGVLALWRAAALLRCRADPLLGWGACALLCRFAGGARGANYDLGYLGSFLAVDFMRGSPSQSQAGSCQASTPCDACGSEIAAPRLAILILKLKSKSKA